MTPRTTTTPPTLADPQQLLITPIRVATVADDIRRFGLVPTNDRLAILDAVLHHQISPVYFDGKLTFWRREGCGYVTAIIYRLEQAEWLTIDGDTVAVTDLGDQVYRQYRGQP